MSHEDFADCFIVAASLMAGVMLLALAGAGVL